MVAVAVAAPAQVPNPRTDWGLSLAVLDAARAAVASMSLEELAGQVIVAAVQAGILPVERLQGAATRVVALQMWTAGLRA